MIVLTRTTGQKLLFEGRHEQAVPAAMQSLRFAIDVHGLASIELVPSYLILGEASIGMNAELVGLVNQLVLHYPDFFISKCYLKNYPLTNKIELVQFFME